MNLVQTALRRRHIAAFQCGLHAVDLLAGLRQTLRRIVVRLAQHYVGLLAKRPGQLAPSRSERRIA